MKTNSFLHTKLSQGSAIYSVCCIDAWWFYKSKALQLQAQTSLQPETGLGNVGRKRMIHGFTNTHLKVKRKSNAFK
jgi:hypothetical protein